MNTEFATKIKALAIAVAINAAMLGATAYLFDGKVHQNSPVTAETHAAKHSTVGVVLAAFRP